MLGTTIRESNRVRSGSITVTITSLSSIESSAGVVIGNSIGVGVGRRLIGVSWLSISLDNRGMVGWSSVDNWGMIGRSSMDNWGMVCWGSMDNRGMICRGSMDDRGMVSRGSMVSTDGSMANGNRSVSTMGRLDLRKTL